MNKKELKLKFDKMGIPHNIYSLVGEEGFVGILLVHNKNWIVSELDERGGKSVIGTFTTEADACEFIFNLMKEIKNRYNL
jgi:hypothetical protein